MKQGHVTGHKKECKGSQDWYRALEDAHAAQSRGRLGIPHMERKKTDAAPGAWETAREQAGVADFHFHDLRHTFASYMATSGATLREIAEVLGHRNIQETMQYRHLTESHTRSIVSKIGQKFLQPEGSTDGQEL